MVSQTNEQMASLQLYAKEVSLAYGIKQKLEGPSDISSEGKLVPSFAESLEEYNYLVNADKWPLQPPLPPLRPARMLRPASGRWKGA